MNKLEDLSIYDLRNYARSVGVKSPTKLKKEDLINQINAINNGTLKPQEPSKRGRPHKEIFGANVQSALIPSDLNEFKLKFNEERISGINSIFTFSEPDDVEEFNSDVENISRGILEILDNGNGLIRKTISENERISTVIFIKSQDILKYNLRTGDELLCKSVFTEDNKPMLLTEIISINDIPDSDWNLARPDLNSISTIFNSESVVLNDNDVIDKIILGNNIFIYGSNVENLKKMLQICNSSNNFNIVYLNIASTEKEKSMINSVQNISIFSADFSSEKQTQLRIVEVCIERCNRLLEMNKNVLLCVNDIISIASIDDENLSLTKKLLTSAKNTKLGSITICTGMPNNETFNLQSKVLSIFSKLEDVRI